MTKGKKRIIYVASIVLIIIYLGSAYLSSKIQYDRYYKFRQPNSFNKDIIRLNNYIKNHSKNTSDILDSDFYSSYPIENVMLELARSYYIKKEYKKADTLLLEAAQIELNNKLSQDAMYLRGVILVEQFKYSKAVEQLEKILSINKNNIEALKFISKIYFISDRQKALEYAKKATITKKELLRHQGEKDIDLALSKRWETIVAEFDTKFEDDPAAATIEIMGEFIEAPLKLELCKNVLKSNNPSDPQKMQELLERMGMLYTEVGMNEEAINTYKTLIETTPTYGRGYILLADRSIKTNNLTLIDELYDGIQKQQGLEIEKDIIDALVQYKRGKTDYALKKLHKINSKNYEIILNHITGGLHKDLGDNKNAIKSYNKIYNTTYNEDINFYYWWAILHEVEEEILSMSKRGKDVNPFAFIP
ncbi:MAG TPA: hypothetical protein GX392_06260 [Clostridiales bacterium]|nr:hypothetical protein [Clostridiales bacterium]